MKRQKIAINGFGRIGRTLLRILLERDEMDVVAINDLSDVQTMAHLFRYDSVHGKFKGGVTATENSLVINGKVITCYSNPNPSTLNWQKHDVDVVVECTGHFKKLDLLYPHLAAGAKRVLLSAPPDDDAIPMIVCGVNEHILSPDDRIVSCASCTTNNAAPMIQMIDECCGIESCYITTVHSYTSDQRLQDAPHKDLRRSRAAAVSIVPTTTGAARALTRIFPHLSNVLGGCGIRVPVPDGSLTDITCIVKNTMDRTAINAAFYAAANHRWKGIVAYTEDPIVSADVIGNTHSCLFDAQLTSVIGKMVKVVGWYDNESGYANRLADWLYKW